jgi:serine/threonine protein kinase
MEYIPLNLSLIIHHYKKHQLTFPFYKIQSYTLQLLTALAHIHSLSYIHRDIKPSNLLVYPTTGTLKLCDFGSSKLYQSEKGSLAYAISRPYRPPELFFGSTTYDFSVDVWSCGCVAAEMALLRPLFQGNTTINHLVQIIAILGTPSQQQILRCLFVCFLFSLLLSFSFSFSFTFTFTFTIHSHIMINVMNVELISHSIV